MAAPVLRWGILGTGHIAARFATQVAALGGRAELRAVGSGDPGRAAAFAATYGVASHGSYAAVLADPGVDAVYVALLNRDHAAWCLAAAAAGKRILCEKPAALDAVQLERILAGVHATGTSFVEAFAYRFHPRWLALRAAVATLGTPLTVQAQFCFHGGNPLKPRLLDPLGGGALMDVGCYPLSWSLGLIGAEPEQVQCSARLAASGVDLAASIAMRFPGGHLASVLCACDSALPTMACISGPAGQIEVVEPFRNLPGSAMRLRRGGEAQDLPWQDDGLELYAREALALAACVGGEHPAMSWEDSRALARVLDHCRAQAGVRWAV